MSKKLESSFKNMLIVLTTISLVSALALGSVYKLTKEPIELAKKEKQENAIKEVLPEYTRLGEADTIYLEGLALPFVVYLAYNEEDLVGAAVQSHSNKGFSGEIKVMVGFDVDGNIVNYAVLEQMETPGLGTKMVDWFKTDKGKQNILGMDGGSDRLKVTKDGGEVDAITAATISSRAFLESIRLAYAAYNDNYDGMSGATSVSVEENAVDEVSISSEESLDQEQNNIAPESQEVAIVASDKE
jgi:electron transport complex protein RnfG